MMVVWIPLTKGQRTQIDEEDKEFAKAWTWHTEETRKRYYAATQKREHGKAKVLYLHRMLLGAKNGEIVMHLNGDTLDNRRSNLRVGVHKWYIIEER